MEPPKHFLFIAGALRERSSLQSAELQLTHQVWGLRTALIRDNLHAYLSADSHGLVYILKAGICAEFKFESGVLPFQDLDELLRDELRAEARYGFVRIQLAKRWGGSAEESLALLERVLQVSDRGELTRRLTLGMHGLTQAQYDEVVKGLG